MKKYKTTKKHPLCKQYKSIELKDELLVKYNDHSWSTEDGSISEWLEKGWIKEVKEKVWVVYKSYNWKLGKEIGIPEKSNSEETAYFKSKKAALKFVLKEAKERFPNGIKIRQKSTASEIVTEIKIGKCSMKGNKSYLFNSTGSNRLENNMVIWDQKDGWIAEPIPENKYPKTVDDLMEFAPNSHYYIDSSSEIYISSYKDYFKDKTACTTEKTAEALLALTELIKFRDLWWQVDGWMPDWDDDLQVKSTIENLRNCVVIGCRCINSHPLAFKDEKTAKDFLETFKKQIETAKELL